MFHNHKPNFENNPTTRLINPAKNEIGRISKQIIDTINNTLKLRQWNNTTQVIDWFKKIESKKDYKFMVLILRNSISL